MLSANKNKRGKHVLEINRRHFIAAGTAAAAMPYLTRGAFAQRTWPSRSIRMVCGYAAGGQTDLLARTFGDYISKQVGQNSRCRDQGGRLRLDRRGGSRACGARRSHHPVRHFEHLRDEPGLVEESRRPHGQGPDARQASFRARGLLLVANKASGVKTLDDFVAFARKKGRVNFGTFGAGSGAHMTVIALNQQYGLKIEPIHYRGEAPMWTGLMDGTLDAVMGSYAAAQAVLQSNMVVVFAVHTKKVDVNPLISRRCLNRARRRSSSP